MCWATIGREYDGRFIASIPDLGDLAAYGAPTRTRWLTSPTWRASVRGLLWTTVSRFCRDGSPRKCQVISDQVRLPRGARLNPSIRLTSIISTAIVWADNFHSSAQIASGDLSICAPDWSAQPKVTPAKADPTKKKAPRNGGAEAWLSTANSVTSRLPHAGKDMPALKAKS